MKSHPAYSHRFSFTEPVFPLLASFSISIALTACLSPPRPHLVIHEDPRGSVYLETMPDASFQASHPISLSLAVIVRLLEGLQVQEDQRLLQTLASGTPNPVRAFSDDDVAFLTRHVATALSQATARQLVRFRILQSAISGTETTEGALFTSGHFLHVSLTRFRYNPEMPSQGSKPGRELRDPTGMNQRHLLFTPEAAQSPVGEKLSVFSDTPPRLTVVVDSGVLAQLPESQHKPMTSLPRSDQQIPKPEQVRSPDGTQELPSAPSEEVRSMRALIEKQAEALEALKKQVESLQHHETEATTTPPKPKKHSVPRTPDTLP